MSTSLVYRVVFPGSARRYGRMKKIRFALRWWRATRTTKEDEEEENKSNNDYFYPVRFDFQKLFSLGKTLFSRYFLGGRTFPEHNTKYTSFNVNNNIKHW